MNVTLISTRRTLTPVAAARMQQAMQIKPHSLDDLALVSGLAKPTVTRYVNDLHEEKMVHVGDWGRDSRGYPTIRKFAWGTSADAVCPRNPRTSAERMAAIRAAQKAGAQ